MLTRDSPVESQGAVVIPNANGKIPPTPEELQKEDPPGIIRKQNGAFTYTPAIWPQSSTAWSTSIRTRCSTSSASPQTLHFKTLFAQARRWGYDRVELEHIKFGSVLGEDRKPFSTRKGGRDRTGRS